MCYICLQFIKEILSSKEFLRLSPPSYPLLFTIDILPRLTKEILIHLFGYFQFHFYQSTYSMITYSNCCSSLCCHSCICFVFFVGGGSYWGWLWWYVLFYYFFIRKIFLITDCVYDCGWSCHITAIISSFLPVCLTDWLCCVELTSCLTDCHSTHLSTSKQHHAVFDFITASLFVLEWLFSRLRLLLFFCTQYI